ncbi:MAG: sodium-translocating pyrophosphatase, partial [Treponema sp.]|nr:sodium-translocating pyrophosphatase [Treponema sp.]
MDALFWLGIVGAVIAIGFAFIQQRRVLKNSEGNDKMKEIAKAIREGANAYLKRQYRLVIIFFAVMTAILAALAYIPWIFGAPGLVNEFIPFAFLTGGFFTGLAGFIGMKAATKANARTAYAAQQGLNRGLRVAFSSGTVMGFVVAGFGLLDIAAWYLILHYVFERGPEVIAPVMLTFGMGVASMSMFARVGGGIFTKAADVGADLVGKVEENIPEDDPRNPAVIADNVGDNVGDVAGMGADLYESYANALVATFAIGVAAGYGSSGLLLPILIASVGIIASIVGTFCVQTKENATQESLLRSLHRGTYVAGAISAITALPLTWFVANNTYVYVDGVRVLSGMAQNVWGIYGSVLIGLVAGFIIAHSTEVFTSVSHKHTKELAKSSERGTAMIIIGGIALGMKSSAIPILTVGISIIISFIFSGGLRPDDPTIGFVAFNAGLYGIGLAAVGMLATLSVTLAADAYGPVADNAGGIAQMAGLPDEVRERTDALDSLGNTTAAIGKGFAIGSTAFTAVALLVSYVNIANDQLIAGGVVPNDAGWALNLQLTNPPMLVGLFLGAVMCFVFAAFTIGAVGNAAGSIVEEVRRQFKEIVGLREGKEGVKPDYAACVDICTKSAQKEMLRPALLVILAPIVIGAFLGPEGVIGLLSGVIVTGFPMAVFMLSAGGAWDNAKKYIEKGRFGGKGSDSHKAAVIGDTIGDPLKDTTGPSYNLLITLSSTV